MIVYHPEAQVGAFPQKVNQDRDLRTREEYCIDIVWLELVECVAVLLRFG